MGCAFSTPVDDVPVPLSPLAQLARQAEHQRLEWQRIEAVVREAEHRFEASSSAYQVCRLPCCSLASTGGWLLFTLLSYLSFPRARTLLQAENAVLQRCLRATPASQTDASRLAMERHRGAAQGSLEAVEATVATLGALRSQLLLLIGSIKALQEDAARGQLQGAALESLSRTLQCATETAERVLHRESATREMGAAFLLHRRL